MATLLVIQHVAHERLGTLEPAFAAAGCALRSLDASNPSAAWPSVREFDGLASMGGPGTVRQAEQKEIGWYPLMRELGAERDPLLAAFDSTETVFQWHGEAFTLPKGAVRLASSPLCPEQAFRSGDQAWGLQFHVEMTEPMIRAWLAQLAIRRQSRQHLGRLRELSERVARTFAGQMTRARRSRRAAGATPASSRSR